MIRVARNRRSLTSKICEVMMLTSMGIIVSLPKITGPDSESGTLREILRGVIVEAKHKSLPKRIVHTMKLPKGHSGVMVILEMGSTSRGSESSCAWLRSSFSHRYTKRECGIEC